MAVFFSDIVSWVSSQQLIPATTRPSHWHNLPPTLLPPHQGVPHSVHQLQGRRAGDLADAGDRLVNGHHHARDGVGVAGYVSWVLAETSLNPLSSCLK